ncbi:MAG: polysaccharide biosynthesis protein [Prevotella sp.]|nr:polysaccharide biosynthesis protein [Prevotella sp.]
MDVFRKLIDWYFTKNALPYWSILVVDCIICYFSGILVFWFYYRGAITLGNIVLLSKTILVYMCFNFIGFKVFHTYSGIIRYSSFVDLQRVAYAMALSCAIAEVAHYIVYYLNLDFVRLQGRQIFLMYFVAVILMWALRIFVKTLYDVAFGTEKGQRAFVYGVHEGGVALAKMIRNTKPAMFQLKGFIMHDKTYRGRTMMGVKIYEPDEKLPGILKTMNIQALLISPLQTEYFRNNQKLQDLFINAGVQIFMTSSQEWKEGDELTPVQLKEIKIEDLLPRNQIQVDMDAIGKMLTGKRVMITGSAGSIGSEMVRQIAVYHPANMILIDQAETPQHDIRLMMANNYPDIPCKTIVVSITQKERMNEIFMRYHPEYLFHAAAYKHVPMMEDNPSEAIYNNIYGTKIIADLSVKYNVRKFVMISTDKAVNPTNVMGCSKRICEIYCQSLNRAINAGQIKDGQGNAAITEFVTTRFGNVLGSNGSVIPLFEKQIKSGGPVTVTDPNIIRFFMLIPEACKLVLEAGTHGRGGQIFVFDMGKPVRIADLAMRMIRLSGAQGVKIKYTGLRAGEKLYEEVLSNTENTLPSFHKKIRISKVREYDFKDVQEKIDNLISVSETFQDMEIVKRMKEMVPEYHPKNTVYSVIETN